MLCPGGEQEAFAGLWNKKHILQPKRRLSHQFRQVARRLFSASRRPASSARPGDEDRRASGCARPVEPPQHGPRSHSAPPGASLPINSEHSQQREGLTNATVPCTSILTEQARGRVSNERQSPRCARHHADWQQQQRQPGSTGSGFIGLHTSVLRKFQVTNGDRCACGSHTFPHIHKW